MSLQAIDRKKELLQKHTEDYLRSKGWTPRILGWYWVWTLSTAVDGKDEQFTVFSWEAAYDIERVLQEITPYYSKPKKESNET